MISSGAHVSRYLIQSIIGHYTKGNIIKHLRSRWCRTMSYTSFAHFVGVGASRYGDNIDVSKGGSDAALIEGYIVLKKSSNPSPDVLEEQWTNVRETFEKYEFRPWDDKDPITKSFTDYVTTEPRLLPLARRNGFGKADEWHASMLRKLFAQSLALSNPSEGEAAYIAKSLLELFQLDSEIYISRTLAGMICMEKIKAPHGFATLKILNASNGLRFELKTLIVDLLKLFNNTSLLFSREIFDLVSSLYQEITSMKDAAARSVMIFAIFAQSFPILAEPGKPGITQTMQTAALDKITERLESHKLGPLTKLDLMQVLEQPTMTSHHPVFLYIAHNQSKLELSDSDINAIAENTTLSALTCDGKGLVIKDLAPKHSLMLCDLLLRY
ncbi:hypothetical protein DL93DRAFT_259372 [Clavulina sp. PMI_390]|nr:hypothetical protein DL93DRAFT_259372 [Clavulina sp. PMI_390]